MRPTRAIATAILLASLAVAGCAGGQSDRPASPQTGQTTTPVAKSPQVPILKPPRGPVDRPAVLADGRHPVCLKAVDPRTGAVTFDLVQWYHGADAAREAARDHQESPPPNDYYVRNVNPRLRTLPARSDAVITVNNLLQTQQSIPVSLTRLATLTKDRSPMFWITVRHDQIVRISEQWVP